MTGVALAPASVTPPIRVAVVDNHPVFRAALRGFLAYEPDLQLVAEASNAAEILPLLETAPPDILLVDFATIELDTLGILGLLFRRLPSRRILVMCTGQLQSFFHPPFQFDLCTLIDKQSVPDRLVALIHRVTGTRCHRHLRPIV